MKALDKFDLSTPMSDSFVELPIQLAKQGEPLFSDDRPVVLRQIGQDSF